MPPATCISSAMPIKANNACAPACSRRSTKAEAAAAPPATPLKLSSRARTTSPPTAATGNSTLTAPQPCEAPQQRAHAPRQDPATGTTRRDRTRQEGRRGSQRRSPVLHRHRPRYAALRDSRSGIEAKEPPQTRKRRGLQRQSSSTGCGACKFVIFAFAQPGG